jgi:hypothetical protein
MTGKWALFATLLLALTLASMPASASTSSPEAPVTAAAAAPGADAAVEAELSRQQQSVWLGSLLLSFLAMIGSMCLVSAWAAWAFHRSVATAIRCGAVARRPVRIPARAAPRPALRPAAPLPQPAELSLDDLFSLAADRRPAPLTAGARVIAWGRRVEAPLVAAVARLGGQLGDAVRRGLPTGRRVLRWNGAMFAAVDAPTRRRVLRWNGLAFVGGPEEAHRGHRPAVAGDRLRLAS